MSEKNRFLVSYILNNQPGSLEVNTDADTLSVEEAKPYIEAVRVSSLPNEITDIQVIGIHRPLRPDVRPGHYQQPEG